MRALNCVANRRKWWSKRGARGCVGCGYIALEIDENGARKETRVVFRVGSKLHCVSQKMGAEKRAVWPFGFGSGRRSPGSKFGAICEFYIGEICFRRQARVVVWVGLAINCLANRQNGNRRELSGSGSADSRQMRMSKRADLELCLVFRICDLHSRASGLACVFFLSGLRCV